MGHDRAMPEKTVPLQDEQYIALTTFRRSGKGVVTPIWAAPDPAIPGAMVVVTDLNSGKVKRLRNNSVVELQPCNARGVTHGAAVAGTAVMLDGDTTQDEATRKSAHAALLKKYGWQARLLDAATIFRRKQVRTYLRLAVTEDAELPTVD